MNEAHALETRTPDSPLASRYSPSLGVRRGAYQERLRPAAANVIHTTGWGPNRRHLADPERFPTPMDAAIHIYGRLMKAGPHYVVDQVGEIVQTCPENLCAWHVGGRGGRRYRRRRWQSRDTRWWSAAWPGLDSPRDLAGGRLWTPYSSPTSPRIALASMAGSVNANTYGIEVIPPLTGRRDEWSDLCWESLTLLVSDLCCRREIPRTSEHNIRHSDAHPQARSKRNAPWDTPPAQWSWQRFEMELLALDL